MFYLCLLNSFVWKFVLYVENDLKYDLYFSRWLVGGRTYNLFVIELLLVKENGGIY